MLVLGKGVADRELIAFRHFRIEGPFQIIDRGGLDLLHRGDVTVPPSGVHEERLEAIDARVECVSSDGELETSQRLFI